MMRRWARSAVGGLPVEFWYLWTGTLINRIGNLALLYLEMFLVARYHVSASFAGLVIGLSGVGMAAGSLLGGVAADRWGRRPTLLATSLAAAVATYALGLADARGAIAALALAYGLFNGGARPAYSAMLVEVLGERQRVRGFNLNYWVLNIGFAGAATLAGLLANVPRTTVFTIDALTTAVGAVWIFLRVPETSSARIERVPAGGGLGSVLTDRVFMTFVLLNLGTWTVICTTGLMPITMLHAGISPASYGTVIAVNGVMIVLGQLFVPRIVRGMPRTRQFVVAVSLVALGFGAIGFAPGVFWLAGAVAIWTLGEMIGAPAQATIVADLSRPTVRARYQGVASLSFTLSGFIAPVLGGILIDRVGDRAVWLADLALGAAVVAGHVLAGPARERRAAELREAPVAEPVPA